MALSSSIVRDCAAYANRLPCSDSVADCSFRLSVTRVTCNVI